MILNPAVQKPRMARMTRMTRMGTGFTMVESLLRGHPPVNTPGTAISSLSVLAVSSVVPTVVFRLVGLLLFTSPLGSKAGAALRLGHPAGPVVA